MLLTDICGVETESSKYEWVCIKDTNCNGHHSFINKNHLKEELEKRTK